MKQAAKRLLLVSDNSSMRSYNCYTASMGGTGFDENGVYTAPNNENRLCGCPTKDNQAASEFKARSSRFCG
ncbi:hypothetical protein Cflav_PD4669 [Pedosphaera parvula Ellin514]|uniref:Uncharacterized protein n=1 Tax=Pedosphaera parvula (strain Ellin514) TaxID=320771 RepID=B9XEB5_PEDPL|nr:hypothetical protein Cflav_PD4669 [Pedosphaera parvula Ellin514]